MAVKSKRGARRRYNAIINACYRDAAGGTQYGIDWPTLRVTWPERYAEIMALKALFKNLPE
jgi:hypothetical protein